MCTYVTTTVGVEGSGKAAGGWIPVTQASVYVDHPYHAQFEHTVCIDVANPALGPAARVALELTEEAALALVDAIRTALAAAPPGLARAGRSVPG
jgi:hypothetical protein